MLEYVAIFVLLIVGYVGYLVYDFKRTDAEIVLNSCNSAQQSHPI